MGKHCTPQLYFLDENYPSTKLGYPKKNRKNWMINLRARFELPLNEIAHRKLDTSIWNISD